MSDQPQREERRTAQRRKADRKAQEHLNRIRNTTPGLGRIYRLDDVRTVLATDALLAEHDGDHDIATELEALALFVERIEHDLITHRQAVHNEHTRKGGRVDYKRGKYDPENWRGPRP